jgi:hypothetical protein
MCGPQNTRCHLHQPPTRALRVGEFLDAGSLEEGVLEDSLNTTKRLDHTRSVGVQIPKLSIVTLILEFFFEAANRDRMPGCDYPY